MLNCVDYLVSDRALYESRNKDFIFRLLDKEEVARDRGMWQFIGIGIPVLMIVLIGLFIVTGKQIGRASCRERVCLYV